MKFSIFDQFLWQFSSKIPSDSSPPWKQKMQLCSIGVCDRFFLFILVVNECHQWNHSWLLSWNATWRNNRTRFNHSNWKFSVLFIARNALLPKKKKENDNKIKAKHAPFFFFFDHASVLDGRKMCLSPTRFDLFRHTRGVRSFEAGTLTQVTRYPSDALLASNRLPEGSSLC